ncbi:MAG: N-acetylglucosamine-6-phosphate deacetylase [Planctomycetota bacterium]
MSPSRPASGCVDIQVNGYLGVDFSSPDLSLDDIASVCHALWERSTVAFCPTVITSEPEVYEHNLPLLASAIHQPPSGALIAGIHVEGPFLARESCGAHPEDLLCLPDIDMFRKWQDMAEGLISITTLAPELPGGIDFISEVVDRGVIVALGHHMASADDIYEAAAAGARLSTHLGNGLANMLPRHPNPLWSQLACDDLMGSFITDGHHLPREFVRVAKRAKGIDNFIVTSDAAAIAGLPPGPYEWGGQEVVLDAEGKISMAHKDSLAGSAATMRDCVTQMAEWTDLNNEELIKVSRDNPLTLLGIEEDALPDK